MELEFDLEALELMSVEESLTGGSGGCAYSCIGGSGFAEC
jgi:hypothetical protein